MNISVVGTGYVGLVTGTCFAEMGNNVICVDIDEKKVEQLSRGVPTIFEGGLELLLNIDKRRWERLLDTDAFMTSYTAVIDAFDRYMDPEAATWCRRHAADDDPDLVAYFSMEYGLQQSLSIYSGGLGVLSADHLKTSSDLGVPLVSLLGLDVPAYEEDKLPAELAAIPAVKPGSRGLR